MRSYPVELLRTMLEIYSPSGSEERLADYLQAQMSSKGFSVERDGVGNVVGSIGEEGPRILLCGHMDTVPGEIFVRTEGDLLYGRGSVDAKSPLAAMLAGASLAKEQSTDPFRVTLACVVEEETSSKGAKALMASGIPYDLAVFGEPSATSNMIIGYKGGLQLLVTCTTAGGHSASPWLSKNSYDEAYEFWRSLKDSLLQNDGSSKFSTVTGCVTSAAAGDSTNTVPSHARLVVDIRVPPSIKTDEMVKRIEEFTRQYERKQEGARFSLAVRDRTEAFLGDEGSILVRAFRWAIRKTMGRQPLLLRKTGTSDMNLFAESCHIPMIAYGPGDSSLDHTNNEHVRISEYLSSVEVYANAIRHIASIHHTKPLLSHALQ